MKKQGAIILGTGGNYNNGTHSSCGPCNGGANQQWHLP